MNDESDSINRESDGQCIDDMFRHAPGDAPVGALSTPFAPHSARISFFNVLSAKGKILRAISDSSTAGR